MWELTGFNELCLCSLALILHHYQLGFFYNSQCLKWPISCKLLREELRYCFLRRFAGHSTMQSSLNQASLFDSSAPARSVSSICGLSNGLLVVPFLFPTNPFLPFSQLPNKFRNHKSCYLYFCSYFVFLFNHTVYFLGIKPACKTCAPVNWTISQALLQCFSLKINS